MWTDSTHVSGQKVRCQADIVRAVLKSKVKRAGVRPNRFDESDFRQKVIDFKVGFGLSDMVVY